MHFRKFELSNGIGVLLGKNAENNDELVQKFKNKDNVIIHTLAPGSPFCVIEKLNPSKNEIEEAAIICALRSQDWRDHRSDIKLHIFTGKDVKKPFFSKKGSWKVTKNIKMLKIKKRDILNLENKLKENGTT